MPRGTAWLYLAQAVIDVALGIALLTFSLDVAPVYYGTPVSLVVAPLVFGIAALAGWTCWAVARSGSSTKLRVFVAVLQLVAAGIPWAVSAVGYGCLFGCISMEPIAWWYLADPLLSGFLASGILLTEAILGLVADGAGPSVTVHAGA